MFTQNQIKWAQSHDWFAGADNNCIEVRDVSYNRETKEVHEEIIACYTMQELLDLTY